MGANVAMVIYFLVVGGVGIAILKQPRRVAEGLRARARSLYSERIVQRFYTTGGVVIAGIGAVAFALLSLGILIWRLLNGFGFS